METFLDTITTDCTSNPATWTCYPYITYNTSPNASSAPFNWIIANGTEANTLVVSSTPNPFQPIFTNKTLILTDAGQSSERYTFQFQSQKIVIPTVGLTDDNSASQCYYNATTFTASLYTKMPRTYPADSSDSNTQDGTALWPYAVRVEQVSGGGDDVPDCYKTVDGKDTTPITIASNSTTDGGLCNCLYRNWRNTL
jgi:hypothetical protein